MGGKCENIGLLSLKSEYSLWLLYAPLPWAFRWLSFAHPVPCFSCLNPPASSALLSGWFICQFFCYSCDVYATIVSGGGIGGLTLAYALSKSPDIRIDVYEAASKFTEIGAGIGVWWRTRQVLKYLGLEEDVARLLTFRPGQDRGELGV